MKPFLKITVGARNSILSQKQVEEVYASIKVFYPHIIFHSIYVDTIGDRDKKTSLRNLEKTDFFTKDIDQMQLQGKCRVAIHSAKDLPEPLAQGLALAALTKGIDASDSLVLREDEKFPLNGLVGTSSLRREENVRQLFAHARFTDIRGTIQERLAKLRDRQMDGVVIAEAALIRLELTHLHRCRLPGKSAPLQGRLAVIIREDDREMAELFKAIDSSE